MQSPNHHAPGNQHVQASRLYGGIGQARDSPYGQGLSKIQRGHERDLSDVRSMLRQGLIGLERLREYSVAIEPRLIRHPAIDPAAFRGAVDKFCQMK